MKSRFKILIVVLLAIAAAVLYITKKQHDEQLLQSQRRLTEAEWKRLGARVDFDEVGGEYEHIRKLHFDFSPTGQYLSDPNELNKFKALRNLHFVHFSMGAASDEDLALLRDCKNLENMELYVPNITNDGLKHISSLTNLRSLALAYARSVDDSGLKHLQALHKLEKLNLSGTKITDQGLRLLESMTNLKELDLTETSITDAGLNVLKELKQLETINLTDTKITPQGLQDFKKSRPSRRVNH